MRHTLRSRALVAASRWFGRDYAPASIMLVDVLRKQESARSDLAHARLDALADALELIALSENTRWTEDREYAMERM